MKEAPKQEHDFYWSAFWELDTERSSTFAGYGPIPMSKMWQMAREYPLSPSEQRAFVYIMRCLDIEYLDVLSQKSKAASK